MVKDPLGEWDKVYTFCALLVDLGGHLLSGKGVFDSAACFDKRSYYFMVFMSKTV